MAGACLSATGVAVDTNSDLTAILEEIQSMRLEHAATLDKMQQAHTQEIEQLKSAMSEQQKHIEALATGGSSAIAPRSRRQLDEVGAIKANVNANAQCPWMPCLRSCLLFVLVG